MVSEIIDGGSTDGQGTALILLKMLLTYIPPSAYSPPLIKVARLGLFHL